MGTEKVIVGNNGKNAMTFASVIGMKLLNNENIDPLLTNDIEKERTNIIQNTDEDKDEKWTFCDELKDYVTKNKKMFELQKSHERVTRGESFNATEAKKAVDSYTHHLWKAIRKRLSKTDMTQSPCAFSEAPAEGIFSIMERVKQGRGSLSVKHLVQLSRLAAHGPPASTEAAMHLSKAALKNYKSQYGERFCTQFWVPGKTSKIVSELQSKKWDW